MHIFEQLAKQLAVRGLAPAIEVLTEVEVHPDGYRVDIRLRPRPGLEQGREAEKVAGLGMFGRLAGRAHTIELFHRTPGQQAVWRCLEKHVRLRQNLRREEPGCERPFLWIVSSGLPKMAVEGLGFRASPSEGPGVYVAARLLRMGLIVVNELALMRDTLVMRLHGDGETFGNAVEEVLCLPEEAPERVLAHPILVELRLGIPEDTSRRTPEEKEFTMNTYPTLEELYARIEAKGEAKGEAKVRLLRLFEERFGPPPEMVEAAVRGTRVLEWLEQWEKLAERGTREEVVAAIQNRPR